MLFMLVLQQTYIPLSIHHVIYLYKYADVDSFYITRRNETELIISRDLMICTSTTKLRLLLFKLNSNLAETTP